jgi:hypothetical protein
MQTSKPSPSFADRFWSRVEKADGDACWEWTASKFPGGYGRVALPRKNGSAQELDGAHRIAWLLVNGPIPLNLWVLHRCDNRSCCRPDHLFLGTHQDNMADMRAKGRAAIGAGVRPVTAKIEPQAIVEIRSRAAAGESHRAIARSLQLDRRKVDRIVKRELYSTVA